MNTIFFLWSFKKALLWLVLIVGVLLAVCYLQGCSVVNHETNNVYNQGEGATAPVIGEQSSRVLSGVMDVVMKYGGWAAAMLLMILWLRMRSSLKALIKVIDRVKEKMDRPDVDALNAAMADAMGSSSLRQIVKAFRK